MALTYERLVELLTYDPETGEFRNNVARGRAGKGKISGSVNTDGYIQTQIDGKLYFNHRLAWFYMTGKWPEIDIDHEDTYKGNNAFINLREATQSLNGANKGNIKTNRSGYKGVSWDKINCKWLAQIKVKKRQINLGRFTNPSDAHAAYMEAARKHFGEFARAE